MPKAVHILKIESIHCEGCASAVEETLTQVKGVRSVKADARTKAAIVETDDGHFVMNDARAALAKAGFPLTE